MGEVARGREGRGGGAGAEYAIHEEIGHFRVALNPTAKVRLSLKLLNLM